MLSANEEATPGVIALLLGGAVPKEWKSVEAKFLNEEDVREGTWEHWLLRAAKQVIQLAIPGEDKKANPDFYKFEMKTNFALSRSLKLQGWKQYSLTLRLPQVEGLKAKATAYNFHFWAKHDVEGILHSVVLMKLKLEGKYIPESTTAMSELTKMAKDYFLSI